MGKSGRWDRSKVNRVKDFEILTEENVGVARASADLGQAFGSSDAEIIAGANNAEAIQDCKDSKDYKSQAHGRVEAGWHHYRCDRRRAQRRCSWCRPGAAAVPVTV